MGLSESNWWGSQVFCTADIKAPRWCLLLGTELHQQRNKVLLSYTERNEMRLYKDTHLTHSSLLFSFLLCLSQLHLVSLHKVTTVMKSWRSLIHLLLILSRKVLTVARRSSRSEYNSLCALWLTPEGTYVRVGQYIPESSVLALRALRCGGRYYFLGPYQPTEVTNRPLNINLIKFFRKYDKSSKPPQI